MISSQPYLVRAIYDWILDSGFTPYMMVDTSLSGVTVPEAYIRDQKIILNVNPSAIDGLEITAEQVAFSARFSSQSFDIFIPIHAVKAVYAKESESGMMFNEEGLGVMFKQNLDGTPPPEDEPPKIKSKKPALRVVK